MMQQVEGVTRKQSNEILDLVFTSDEDMKLMTSQLLVTMLLSPATQPTKQIVMLVNKRKAIYVIVGKDMANLTFTKLLGLKSERS